MTSNNSGATAQDKPWHDKGQADEARYAREKEQAQLAALREKLNKDSSGGDTNNKDFEGGFGGQEDLEDRYATTSGEH